MPKNNGAESAAARSTAARFPASTIRAYGEMVDVLWKRQQTEAAIRLETLWNDLARWHRFGLLCGYAIGNCYQGSATADICAVHTHSVTELVRAYHWCSLPILKVPTHGDHGR